MERRRQFGTRPRLACEITLGGVIAARASDKTARLDLFTSRRLQPGTIAPGLSRARSAAPTMPRVRGDNTRCTLTTSAVLNNSSLEA